MKTRNRYPGKCVVCGQPVEVNAGYVVKGEGLKHAHCARSGRLTRSERIADHARDLAAEHDARNPFTRGEP